jgi:hypothetical protein
MKISLDLDIQIKDGTLVLDAGAGQLLIIPPDNVVSKKIHMVSLAELSNLTVEEICSLFGYKTRKSYYDIRRAVLQNNIEALMLKKTGPKRPPKRSPELERRIIKLRLTTDKNMYEISQTLNREGFPVGPRLVGQVLSDYGISKKKFL